MTDDSTLLRRYAADRDEDAFAEVVRRNLPLVYSAALRRLGGDTHRAEDVAQIVFCALARHAHRVSRQPVLSGWLYTATRNAVIDVVRAEKRRRRREEEACHMQRIESEPDAPADWFKLRPVLDSAMDQLSARDREAVLLRFFQGRSFGEIGAAVGLSEDAVRKRIDRALAKLRDLLRPNDVASTSTALATLLASQTISAAPAGLLASVTGTALSTGGAVATGIVTFITMTKLQAGIAAAVVMAGAVGLITQHRTISTLRENAAIADERLARLDNENATAGLPRAGVGADLAKIRSEATTLVTNRPPEPAARGQLQAETAAALQEPRVTEKYFALISILQRLTPDNWREVLAAFTEERKLTGLAHAEAFEMFVRRAGEVAGKDVIGYFLKSQNTRYANDALTGWAAKNPAEALQWLGRDADADTRRSVLGAAIRGLALSEPDLAIRTLENLPPRERGKYTSELVSSMLRAVGIDHAQELVEGMIMRAAQAGTLKEEYLKKIFSDYSGLRISQAAASGAMADAVNWLNRHIGQPYVDHTVIAQATERLASQDPRETFRWLEGVNTALFRAGDESTAGYRVLLSVWAGKEGAHGVEAWLQTKTSHPHYDHIAWQYAAIVASQDPNKAVKWANTIKDGTIRKNVLNLISQKAPKKA